MGYRFNKDDYDNTFTLSVLPEKQSRNTLNAFFQYKQWFNQDRTTLTLGTKAENNSFTETEFQPTIRLAHKLAENHTVWGAVSRAVRVPGRIADFQNQFAIRPAGPNTLITFRNQRYPGLESETLVAREAGFRGAFSNGLLYDLAVYYNQYDKLIDSSDLPPTMEVQQGITLLLDRNARGNIASGVAKGGELVLTWLEEDHYQLKTVYSYLDLDVNTDAGSNSGSAWDKESSYPRNQASLSLDLFPTR